MERSRRREIATLACGSKQIANQANSPKLVEFELILTYVFNKVTRGASMPSFHFLPGPAAALESGRSLGLGARSINPGLGRME